MKQTRPTECPLPVEEETEGEMPELVGVRVRPCGGKLVRVFDRPFVIYRGSGFYSTDKVLSDPIPPEDLDD